MSIYDEPNVAIENSIQNGYFNWLSGSVMIDRETKNYRRLLMDLHSRPYYSFIPNDDNRGEDGLKLREVFANDYATVKNYFSYLRESGCTVLEMLVALATRIEDMLYGEGDQKEIARWFWRMVENLDLMRFADDVYLQSDGKHIITMVLDVLLQRTYTNKGVGGLFPLKRSKNDQRKVEIWYQLQEYLAENSGLIRH